MEYISHTNVEVIKDLLEKSVEICGHLIPEEQGGYLPYLDSVGEKGTCQHPSYFKYIWHTHPHNSKCYPSIEDILKVIKHGSISKSFIFTTWGAWSLSARAPKNLGINVLENIKNDGNVYLTELYFATKKGRVMTNENTIREIVISLLKKLNSKYNIHLKINFNSWREIPCAYNMKN